MNNFSLRFSINYLKATVGQKTVATISFVCFFSIFISTAALALIMSIMQGFETTTHTKLQGIHGQIIMQSSDGLDFDKICPILKKEFPEIIAFSPAIFGQVIIETEQLQEFSGALMVKAIDPNAENATINIKQKVISSLDPDNNLQKLIGENRIIIGKKIANEHSISLGQELNLLYIHRQKGRTISFNSYPAIVSGIFSTGIEEFDAGLIYISFDAMKLMYPDTNITQINIKVAPGTNQSELIKRLKKRFNLDVFSWKDLYPAIVSALKLEKYAIGFILLLIVLISAANWISLMFMFIIKKRVDIAIYHSLGMSKRNIKQIFIMMGFLMSFCAALMGIIFAFCIGLILQKYPFIQLPDTYFATHLPIAMDFVTFILVLCASVAISMIAIWCACDNIKTIEVAQILKNEG